jgi:hypothetical protein
MNYSLIKLAALLAAGLISGCANNPVYEGRFPWEAGWREGAVEAVGETDELRDRYAQRCKLEAVQDPTARFAKIRYSVMGKPKWQTVTVPKDSPLKIGDLVYVKVRDCAGQAVLRAMQKKSAAAQEDNTANAARNA